MNMACFGDSEDTGLAGVGMGALEASWRVWSFDLGAMGKVFSHRSDTVKTNVL